jgi:protein ImuB
MDRWRLAQGLAEGEGADAAPLALVAEAARGVRIAAANRAALAAGVTAGMALADARALCPALATAPSDPAGDLAMLEKLALWAQRWGPWSALDAPDGLIVDVTGVAHLFGGEEALLIDARAALARRRLAARLAIAPTAGAAWALAHYGEDGAILEASSSSLRAERSNPERSASPPGSPRTPERVRDPRDDEIERQLARLPVAGLRLDEDVLTVLRRLGLKRLGDLDGVAREALARRFRSRHAPAANPLIRMDQLLGRVPEPMLPVIAVHAPLVQRRLVEPIRHRDLLDRVVMDLAQDMARVLEGRALGARRLELAMWKVDGEVLMRHLELAAPSRDPAHMAALFARRLDGLDAGFGIEMLRLRSVWSEDLALTQGDFEAAAEHHGTSLAACVDRLVARLGPRAVRRPVPRASHVPERAQEWKGALEPEKSLQETFDFHQRPLKLLDYPEPIAVLYASPDGLPRRFRWRGQVHEVARAEGPERIAPEWWRERSHVRLRDYYRIEDDEGQRYWIYRDGIAGDGRGSDGAGRAPDWFLQGLWG